jgi:hypothetical protein
LLEKVFDEGVIGIIIESILDPFGNSGGGELSEEDVPVIKIGVFGAIWVFWIVKNIL